MSSPVPSTTILTGGSLASTTPSLVRRWRTTLEDTTNAFGADVDRTSTDSSVNAVTTGDANVRVIGWLDDLVSYQQTAELECACPIDEAVQRLQNEVSSVRSSCEGLRGVVSRQYACVYWRTTSIRAMRPYFVGRFTTDETVTVLRGRFASNIVLRVFLSIWFAGVVTGIAMALLLPFFDPDRHFGRHLAGIGLTTGMLLAGVWMVRRERHACSDHVQNIIDALENALQADLERV